MKFLAFVRRQALAAAAIFLGTCLMVGTTRAASLDSRINVLEAAIRKELADQDKKASDTERRMRDYEIRASVVSLLSQMRSAVERGDIQQIGEQLDQISSKFSSEGVMKAATELRTQVKADQAAQEKAFAIKVADVLAFVEKAVKTATKPSDLDEALTKLSDVSDRSNYRLREKIQDQMNRVSAVRQFVVYWQDYLVAAAAGDKDRARSSLQSAAGNEEGAVLPRSEILAKMGEMSGKVGARQTLSDIVGDEEITLRRIPTVLASLSSNLSGSPSPGLADGDRMAASALQSELSDLQSAYLQYQAGLPAKLNVRGNRYGNSEQARIVKYVLPPKTQFLRLVLPEYLGTNEKVSANETVQAYLDRVLARASSQLDTQTIAKIVDLQSALQNSNVPRGNSLQMLIVARNQEDAGQFILAVYSYQMVLKAGDDIIPAKAVGARLDALKAAHPDDYRTGTEKALSGNAAVVAGSFYRPGLDGSIIIPGSIDMQPRESK